MPIFHVSNITIFIKTSATKGRISSVICKHVYEAVIFHMLLFIYHFSAHIHSMILWRGLCPCIHLHIYCLKPLHKWYSLECARRTGSVWKHTFFDGCETSLDIFLPKEIHCIVHIWRIKNCLLGDPPSYCTLMEKYTYMNVFNQCIRFYCATTRSAGGSYFEWILK